jgi:uncharacterized membrane protein
MYKDSGDKKRRLAYVLVGVLAVAAVAAVIYLMGTPGWGSPWEIAPKRPSMQ